MKRLYRSWFGSKKIWQVISGVLKQRHIVAMVRGGHNPTSRKELQELLGAPALLDDLEIPVIQRYAESAFNNIVEIGCAYGGSSLLFLLTKRDEASVYSIDPFIRDSMGNFQATRKLCFGHFSRALKLIGRENRLKTWELISGYSYNVIKRWDKPIDLLFIDGDHRYAEVKRDLVDWCPFVRIGGAIIFHDSCRVTGTPENVYVKGWPGPTQLVKELLQKSDVILMEQTHSLSIFKKIHE